MSTPPLLTFSEKLLVAVAVACAAFLLLPYLDLGGSSPASRHTQTKVADETPSLTVRERSLNDIEPSPATEEPIEQPASRLDEIEDILR